MVAASPLGLRIPEQTQPTTDSFLLEPSKTAAWIADLPLVNLGETSRLTFKALVEANRMLMPDASRIKVVEQFRSPVAYIQDCLSKHYIGAAFPLSPKSRKIAVLNRELQIEMAIAYKTIVRNILANESGRFDRKLLVIAMHRALSYLNNTLLNTYLTYEQYPENIWLEIHRIAAYAFQNKLHTASVKSNGEPEDVSSINEVYIQILLLALSVPHKLRQRELLLVTENIADWEKHAHLKQPALTDEKVNTDAIFICDLWSDAPPTHVSLKADSDPRYTLFLDTSDLLQHLRETLNQASTQVGEGIVRASEPDKSLLTKLIDVWSKAQKREHARTSLNFLLKVAVGLNSICGHMRGENKRPGKDKDKKNAVSGDDWQGQTNMLQHALKSGYLQTGNLDNLSLSPLGSSDRQPSIDAHVNTHENSVPGVPANKETKDVWSSYDPVSLKTHVFRTVNESAGGYCVRWTGSNVPHITIGELIGIQSATQERQFGLAVVRWMKHTTEEGLKLGMQMLAPNVYAMQILPDQDDTKEAQNCLLVPHLRASATPASLIVPALMFDENDLVKLKDGQKEVLCKLTYQVQSTGVFAQFLFQKAVNPDKVEEESANYDFDSIWSQL